MTRAAAGLGASTAYEPSLKADRDHDNDTSAPHDDTNNSAELHYGHPANAADRKAITTLIRGYYRAAVAGDGAAACSLIYSSLVEAIPEDFGQYGPPYLRGGKTCVAVMDKLFNHLHTQLAAELPRLSVATVRLKKRRGLVFLSFGALPERKLFVEREGAKWKLGDVIDGELS